MPTTHVWPTATLLGYLRFVVLFNERFVPGLMDGSITLAFRHWRKPAAKMGGRQRIPGGVLQIDDVRGGRGLDN